MRTAGTGMSDTHAEEKSARIDAIVADARLKALPGPDAARSADFLYGPDGLPN